MSKEPICIKRLNADNKHMFIVKQGEISIEIDEEKAEYICRTLAIFMGLNIKSRDENIAILTQKANQNQLGA